MRITPSQLTAEQLPHLYDILDQAIRQDRTAAWACRTLIVDHNWKFSKRSIQVAMQNRRAKKPVQPENIDALVLSATRQPPQAPITLEDETKPGSEQRQLDYRSGRIVTLDDALKKAEVDATRWDVERFIVNSWEVGAKGPDKKILVTPLWQVKVWLKAKKGWNPSEFRALLLDDMKKLAPNYTPFIPKVRPEKMRLLAELSIFDAHFGKLAWSPESGQDYDLKICRDRYMRAAHDLLQRARDMRVERVLYVVGNDFFHADHGSATTSGTELDCDGRWQKSFRIGAQCAIEVAEYASHIGPVDILIVPGNHDQEKTFCLGELLAARFHQNHEINVLNDPDPYAYYRYGKTLLGFVHGQNHTSEKKRAQLPQTMLEDRPLDSAEAIWREWHLGHFHSEAETIWQHRSVERIRTTAVRVLPSLSSTDAWHRQSGYASVLAAECHIYHKERGRYAYLVHQTTP